MLDEEDVRVLRQAQERLQQATGSAIGDGGIDATSKDDGRARLVLVVKAGPSARSRKVCAKAKRSKGRGMTHG